MVGGSDHPMIEQDGGWWIADLPVSGAETSPVEIDYGFRLDDDPDSTTRPALPAPASTACTDSSRSFDSAGFDWGDTGWTGPGWPGG